MYGKNKLVAISCDRTEKLASAHEDIKILGTGQPPVEQVILSAGNSNIMGMISAAAIAGLGASGYLVWLRIKR
ncbi:hypothetical protein JOC77_004101 [Peribacillus deserti]|uniref:Uncharacterized protein n=1 Tax=Peribacillus deserti TaxID=673318 RepID=A0ABS2QN85_9BACI|nr:hypothetical protein [Peribacillus deserti]MBM7694626.1 hypothetical protein [Peribacillus deserti]